MMQIHIQLQDLCTLNKFFIKVPSILSKFMQKHGWKCSGFWQNSSFFLKIFNFSYTSSVNYFCETSFSLQGNIFIWFNNEITSIFKHSCFVLYYCQQNFTMYLKPLVAYTNNIAYVYCWNPLAFWKCVVFIPAKDLKRVSLYKIFSRKK